MLLGIYGSGGLGREIYEIALRRNAASKLWSAIVFIDDIHDPGDYFGTKRISFDTLYAHKEDYECVVAVGEPSSREALYKKLVSSNVKLTNLIDVTAIVSPTAKLGIGSIVCEYSTIHTEVDLGINSLVQPFCNIGHDIKVGNHTVLSPYCAPGGGTVFGDRVFVGMKVSIMESIVIGDDAIVGMGSAVFRDVPTGSTVIGNPARVTRGNDEHKVYKSEANKA